MKHLSFRYHRRRNAQEQREFCAEQSRRISGRWAKVHAAAVGDPVRQTRTNRITIEDTHTTRTIIHVHRDQTERGWSRARVEVNGIPCGQRAWGLRQLAKAIARIMQ
jgi:hypothetical protein